MKNVLINVTDLERIVTFLRYSSTLRLNKIFQDNSLKNVL